MQQRIENITCRIGRNQVKAIADYNAKCSATTCKNFLDINCIFDNVYWIHVVQFCFFIFLCFMVGVGACMGVYLKRDRIKEWIFRVQKQLPNIAEKELNEEGIQPKQTEE